MNISEDNIPEKQDVSEIEAPRPPIFINELPKPQPFTDDDEEIEALPPIKSLRTTPSVTDFYQFLENPVTDSSEVVTATDEPVTDSLQVVTANNEPVTDSSEIVTVTDEPVTDNSEFVTVTDEPVTDISEVVTVTDKPVTDSLKVVTVIDEPVTDSSEFVTTDSEPVTDSSGVVTTETEPVTDSPKVVTIIDNSQVKKNLITNETPTSTVKVLTKSLDRLKEFYNTSSFRTLGDASAYIFDHFENVFDYQEHIAELNRMTLERNQLKQQVEEGFNDNDKEMLTLQKQVEDYQQQIIKLTNERDEAKNSLGQLVERNIADNQVKEATSSDTWQEKEKALIVEFTAEFKKGLQECQQESVETVTALFEYAMNHAISLMYQDTRKLHNGTGLFKTSAIRTESDFYTMFKMYFQQYYDHAEKIKETETLQNSDQ